MSDTPPPLTKSVRRMLDMLVRHNGRIMKADFPVGRVRADSMFALYHLKYATPIYGQGFASGNIVGWEATPAGKERGERMRRVHVHHDDCAGRGQLYRAAAERAMATRGRHGVDEQDVLDGGGLRGGDAADAQDVGAGRIRSGA